MKTIWRFPIPFASRNNRNLNDSPGTSFLYSRTSLQTSLTHHNLCSVTSIFRPSGTSLLLSSRFPLTGRFRLPSSVSCLTRRPFASIFFDRFFYFVRFNGNRIFLDSLSASCNRFTHFFLIYSIRKIMSSILSPEIWMKHCFATKRNSLQAEPHPVKMSR